MDHVADQRDDPVDQANAAIRDLIESQPGGRITPDTRPEYERLLDAWLAAVQERDSDDEPVRLAA